MHEGWHADTYLILFDQAESANYSAAYEVEKYLPAHTILGLAAWDDFILLTPDNRLMTVPTIPIAEAYLAPLDVPINPAELQPDDRFTGKVKWYKKPLVFGGNPADADNVIWVPLKTHADLVRYWNSFYLRLKA